MFKFFLCLNSVNILKISQTKKADPNLNLIDIYITLLDLAWTFALIFSVCELGEQMSNGFDSFDDKLCQCDWYSFPIQLQQIYLIFLSNTQQPTNIACYGNISCTRDTFKKVSEFWDLRI